MLRNSEVIVGGLQLSSTSEAAVGGKIRNYDSFELGYSVVSRREIVTRRAIR